MDLVRPTTVQPYYFSRKIEHLFPKLYHCVIMYLPISRIQHDKGDGSVEERFEKFIDELGVDNIERLVNVLELEEDRELESIIIDLTSLAL